MKNFLTLPLLGFLIVACSQKESLEVVLDNALDTDRDSETVELSLSEIRNRLGGDYFYVAGPDGCEIPSQITHDSLLIFQASVPAGASVSYRIYPSDTLRAYAAVTTGRLYPERADDIAWENDLVGFRVYGPATQAKGEKAFGYDIFFKHPDRVPVLERLYEPETNPATWIKADSLRAIDPALAEEFIRSISYHIDHGLGMDCYAVGPTLGDGVAALADGDTIFYPWCYREAEVLDNGPIRFSVAMIFAPVAVRNDSAVVEKRLISLDSGCHLNHCLVWYEGLSADSDIVAGFPRRDNSVAVMDSSAGIVAYADPTQGPDNGKALLGLIIPSAENLSVAETSDHILARTTISPSDTLDYYWGFAWDRADIADIATWRKYLSDRSAALRTPLKVTLK